MPMREGGTNKPEWWYLVGGRRRYQVAGIEVPFRPIRHKAHSELDQAVFKLFGLRKVLHEEGEKQELLFNRYVKMVEAN